MAIKKSLGTTPTEKLLSELCDRTFLKLWSYPNPFKDDHHELCDLIAVFENHVFLFFDRDSRKFDGADVNVLVAWNRWLKEAVQKQIKTAHGAARYIQSGRKIYLDGKNDVEFPFSTADVQIHKFIVAHGAKEACEAFSDENINGCVACSYGDNESTFPFLINLDRSDPVHVLDGHNLEIVFSEPDTFFDFLAYVVEKERAIATYNSLVTAEKRIYSHTTI